MGWINQSLTDRLNDPLTGWLILTYYWTNQSVADRQTDRLNGLLTGSFFAGLLMAWIKQSLTDRQTEWLTHSLMHRLIQYITDKLTSLLTQWQMADQWMMQKPSRTAIKHSNVPQPSTLHPHPRILPPREGPDSLFPKSPFSNYRFLILPYELVPFASLCYMPVLWHGNPLTHAGWHSTQTDILKKN